MKKLFVISILLAITLSLLFIPKTNAVSAVDWRAGNIIDDVVFTDKSSMTVNQVQDFLNSKVPVCDTNGINVSELGGGTRAQYGASHSNPIPYTCLKDYYEVPKTEPGPGIPVNNITCEGIIPPISLNNSLSGTLSNLYGLNI